MKYLAAILLVLVSASVAFAFGDGGFNAGFGTSVPVGSLSGDFTCTSAGVCTVTKTGGVSFATIATSGSASDLSAGTVAYARLPVAKCGGPVAITSLPTCDASTQGQCYIVTDALLPALGSVIANGGALRVTVACVNGTGWIP